MKIADKAFVSMEYTLALDGGKQVDHSDPGDPLTFIFGEGMLVPGVERHLEGLEAGGATNFVVDPEDGYGAPDPRLHRDIPKDQFPEELNLEVGMVLQAESGGHAVPFRVKEITDEVVVADMNHPLAGERLHFDIKIVSVREATEEEIAAVQAHSCGHDHSGCGGCHGHDGDCN